MTEHVHSWTRSGFIHRCECGASVNSYELSIVKTPGFGQWSQERRDKTWDSLVEAEHKDECLCSYCWAKDNLDT